MEAASTKRLDIYTHVVKATASTQSISLTIARLLNHTRNELDIIRKGYSSPRGRERLVKLVELTNEQVLCSLIHDTLVKPKNKRIPFSLNPSSYVALDENDIVILPAGTQITYSQDGSIITVYSSDGANITVRSDSVYLDGDKNKKIRFSEAKGTVQSGDIFINTGATHIPTSTKLFPVDLFRKVREDLGASYLQEEAA